MTADRSVAELIDEVLCPRCLGDRLPELVTTPRGGRRVVYPGCACYQAERREETERVRVRRAERAAERAALPALTGCPGRVA